jgi:predicted transcriptional regulator
MPNKTARKELSLETIAVILALHKLGYTALQISREEGLTKDVFKIDNYLSNPTREKASK